MSTYIRTTPLWWRRMSTLALLFALCAGFALVPAPRASAATPIEITGPAGSAAFGGAGTILPNGNVVVVDTGYDDGNIADVGAVYLYSGATHTLISMLTGSSAGDQIGSGGITTLANGNYVIRSPLWQDSASARVGAATWASATSGISGTISSENSLIGTADADRVGSVGIVALPNGHYLVRSPLWDNGSAADAGAVTWGSGSSGVSGAISASNSLLGTSAGDQVGSGGIIVLSNNNYVVRSPSWDNAGAADAGAVTWGSGSSGVSGLISPSNSLLGTSAGDQVGSGGITVLSNNNYVVRSPSWDNGSAADAGAVTWGSGSSGVSGAISASNSLVGSTASDQAGFYSVTVLSNGNYVVRTPLWDNGSAADVGAVTWGSSGSGVSGAISASNSLIGSTAGDQSGENAIVSLTNGNYVASTSLWDNGSQADAGAATWGNGVSGVSGTISANNSLVGTTAGDQVSSAPSFLVGFTGVISLTNGNYLVGSANWDNAGLANVGALTWGDGARGTSGIVSTTNSLVGSTADDYVGSAMALSNGNYVALSRYWDNTGVANVGAATWGNGASGTSGVVSATNSLVGSQAGDLVGAYGITALPSGNYIIRNFSWNSAAGAMTWATGTGASTGVVSSSNSLVGSAPNDLLDANVIILPNGNYLVATSRWGNGIEQDVGAITWGSGISGVSGVISATNSLIGAHAGDFLPCGPGAEDWNMGITILPNSNYVVSSPYWDNGSATNVGAVTWGSGTSGAHGVISANISLVGSAAGDSVGCGTDYDVSMVPRGNGVTALPNGNYVISSIDWDNGSQDQAGAVTWASGTTGITGTVSASNSLVGTSQLDHVGEQTVVVLANGNYVVLSRSWRNAAMEIVGAVTWGSGTSGVSGAVSDTNSLVGTLDDPLLLDLPARRNPVFFTNGTYVVIHPLQSVTWADGPAGLQGVVSADNSILSNGLDTNFGVIGYDSVYNQLVIGDPGQQRILFLQGQDLPPTITSAAPPDGQVGVDYQHTFAAIGFPSSSFSVTTGSLPPGLELVGETGVLSGTPTLAGTFSFTITADNGVAPAATQDVTITISAGTRRDVFLPAVMR